MKAMFVSLIAGVLLMGPTSRAADDRDEIAKLRKELRERERQTADLQDQLKTAKTTVEVLKKRNDQLMAQIETLTKEVASIKGIKTTIPGERTGALKGIVKQVEKEGGIISISLGKDDGLYVGQKLELFRGQAGKRPLSVIRILEVEDKRALARLSDSIEPGLRPGEEVILTPVSGR